MGFGLLFIGYFIAFFMSVNNYGFAFEIVGYAIILSAVGKLSEYKHSLARSSVPLLIMALCSAYDGFRYLNQLLSFDLALFRDDVAFTVSLISAAAVLLFHGMLLISIRQIAIDADEPAIARKSFPAIGAAAISFLLEFSLALVGNLFAEQFGTTLNVWALVATLVRILYPLAVLAFFYSCYARICAPEDVEMERKPSRFAFINRWREKQDSKAEEVKKMREEYQKQLDEKAKNKASSHNKKK